MGDEKIDSTGNAKVISQILSLDEDFTPSDKGSPKLEFWKAENMIFQLDNYRYVNEQKLLKGKLKLNLPRLLEKYPYQQAREFENKEYWYLLKFFFIASYLEILGGSFQLLAGIPRGIKIKCSCNTLLEEAWNLKGFFELPEFNHKHQYYLRISEKCENCGNIICIYRDKALDSQYFFVPLRIFMNFVDSSWNYNIEDIEMVAAWQSIFKQAVLTDMDKIEKQNGELMHVLKGHTDYITSIIVSKDGKHIISSSRDNTIKIWDLTKGTLLRELAKKNCGKLLMSPDGKYLIVAGYYIWDVLDYKSGDLIISKNIENLHNRHSNLHAISPDSKWVIISWRDKSILLWELDTGKVIKKIQGHTDLIGVAQFSKDGNFFITGSSDYTVKLWEFKTGKLIRTYKGHKSGITSISFSSDGKYIGSSSSDGTINLYDLDTSTIIQTYGTISRKVSPEKYENPFNNPINTFTLSPDMKYVVSGTQDGKVHIWDLENGILIHTIDLNYKYLQINKIQILTKEELMVTFSSDYIIRFWDLKTFHLVRSIILTGNGSIIQLPNGRRVICGFYLNKLRIYDFDKNQIIGGLDFIFRISKILHIPNSFRIFVFCQGNDAFLYDIKELIDNSANNEVVPVKDNVIFGEIFYQNEKKDLKLYSKNITRIEEIEGIKKLTEMERLIVGNNKIKEISGLETFSNLIELNLENNEISEIKGLENLKNLRTLKLKGNRISQDLLSKLGGLEEYKGVIYPQKFVEYCRRKKNMVLNKEEHDRD